MKFSIFLVIPIGLSVLLFFEGDSKCTRYSKLSYSASDNVTTLLSVARSDFLISPRTMIVFHIWKLSVLAGKHESFWTAQFCVYLLLDTIELYKTTLAQPSFMAKTSKTKV